MYTVAPSIKLFLLLSLILVETSLAQAPSHDPTPMQEDGGRYWIFTTGDGIWHMSSSDKDFNGWSSEGGVFGSTWPAWINNYVPGFQGTFWAPGIIYMDGEWHLYYSCSTFGSQTSAIGLVTTPTLQNADWQDQGMVVYSNGNRQGELGYNVNAIDADIFRDLEGRVWMIYGSYWDGIVMTELDAATGKPIDDTNLTHVANGNPEAAAMMVTDDYYYLFFNRGSCCRGLNSTYRMLVGRSKNPTGPFYDKNGVRIDQGGGSLFMHTDGRFIGPGHFGYNENKLTWHYYDGQANGRANLGVGEIAWDEEGWPQAVYKRAGAIDDGVYILTNRNSSKNLQLADDSGEAGTNVEQSTETGDAEQRWKFTYVGDGYYSIAPYLAPDKVLEIVNCSTVAGGNAQIGDSTGTDCQLWYVGRMGSHYRIMSKNSYMALEVENAYTEDGANVKQWPFNEHPTQQWSISAADDVELPLSVSAGIDDAYMIYPNPSNGHISFRAQTPTTETDRLQVSIYTMSGKLLYRNTVRANEQIDLGKNLNKGLYQVRVTGNGSTFTEKLLIQ